MPFFKTPFNGYSVRFSPFYESRLAVATAQNFGILGNGRVHVIDLSPNAPIINELIAYDTADEHAREVHGLDYNPTRRDSFLSASWDDSVKLWTLDRPASLRTFREHAYCVYSVAWNPKHADVFASASGDCTVRIWDVREPGSTMIIPGHEHEILSCDWNKYDECLLASSSVDKSIKIWDVRNYRVPVSVLNGHGYAVRKIKFSPHRRNLIVSCSYDMTVCLWDFMIEDALVGRYDHHTEFAVGVDLSVLVDGLMASTGWDELMMLNLWEV
ncbi:hypothetical protein GOBAR_DD25575 [Gossypium barbadense]|nr:hypothetical protein GOBAR_DD25575 [Gossypium barbadense]